MEYWIAFANICFVEYIFDVNLGINNVKKKINLNLLKNLGLFVLLFF